jgi:hypothetical protein
LVISTSAQENVAAVKRCLNLIPCCLNAQFQSQEQSNQVSGDTQPHLYFTQI